MASSRFRLARKRAAWPVGLLRACYAYIRHRFSYAKRRPSIARPTNPGADRSRLASLAARPYARGQRLDPLLNGLADRLRSRDRRVAGGLRRLLGVSAARLRRLALPRGCAL